jgi:hypothetical protein
MPTVIVPTVVGLVNLLEFRLVTGFVVIMSATFLLDKAGDYLYHKGIAKPFYVLGHRLHHRKFVLAVVPASYATVATLIYLHYMRVLWSSFWPSAEFTLFLVGVCLTFDLTLDALWTREKRNALLHHEWVYVLVPAYVFTHLVALV